MTKITIDQKGLKQALNALGTVVPSKSNLPILSNVLLSFNSKSKDFTLSASDNEKWLTLECKDSEGNAFVTMIENDKQSPFTAVGINFRELKEAVALLPSDKLLEVTFDTTARTLTVNYQIGQFSMPWELGDEWPAAPVVDKDSEGTTICATLQASALLPWMKQARTCSANDELRPQMNAVCLDISHDALTIVASDGHALYKKVQQMGAGWLQKGTFAAADSEKVLVHKSAQSALDTAFADAAELTMVVGNNCVRWESKGVQMICRLVEGRYPNYNSVIPAANPHEVEVDVRSLLSALRRVRLFADDSSNMARISRDGEYIIIEAEDIDYSKRGNERVRFINADATTLPADFTIGIKISTLSDLLSLVGTDVAHFYFDAPERAAIIKEDAKEQSMTLLVMPMKLS